MVESILFRLGSGIESTDKVDEAREKDSKQKDGDDSAGDCHLARLEMICDQEDASSSYDREDCVEDTREYRFSTKHLRTLPVGCDTCRVSANSGAVR